MNDLRQIARSIFHTTLSAIDIPSAIERSLARSGSRLLIGGAEVEGARLGADSLDLAAFSTIRVVAIGKAGFATAEGLGRALGKDYPLEGLLVVPAAPPRELPGLRTVVAGHPVPDEGSLMAGREVLRLLAQCDDRALIFFLLSGGGSALCEQPLFPGVTLEDMQALHRALVTCGAPIDEMNAVRKHLSAVKGGRLAAASPRAMKITLGVSDVPPGRESALGSGPTLPDPTTGAR